jgi:hypothetical protein
MTYSRNMSETNNKFFEINNCHLSDEFSKKFSLTIEGKQ